MLPCFSQNKKAMLFDQEFAPAPNHAVEVDWRRSDFELFMDGLNIETVKFEDLGDQCEDVSWLY